MYKKSNYNIIIDTLENGNILIYNSFSGAFGIMNKETIEVYENIENIDTSSIESEYTKENIETMKKSNFIIDSDFDEYTYLKVRDRISRFNTNGLALTIAPTLNCNMNCFYCYENKNNKRMNEEVKLALIDYVEKTLTKNKYKYLSINWYGGEPLLEMETIKFISSKFIKICNDNDIEYTASMVTNGVLLNKEVASVLKDECMVTSLQITIDGTEDIHDSRRTLKSKESSFNTIIDNIDNAKDILNIAIRINIDKTNVNCLDDLLQHFFKYKKWENKVFVYLAPIEKQTEHCKINVSNCFTGKEFGEVNATFLKKLYSLGRFDLVKSCYPQPFFSFCNAVKLNSYVIDPDGKFYKCWDNIGVHQENIGDVFNGAKLNSEYMKWLSLELPSECEKCNVLPICQGGCPYIRLNNGNKPACHYKILSYVENLKIMHTEHIKKLSTSKQEA